MMGRSRLEPASRQVLLIVVLVLCASRLDLVTGECIKINSCSCRDGAKVVDLSSLDGGSNPRFKDKLAGDGYYYSWNPCSSFSETGGCTSVSGCQVTGDFQTGYPIGNQDSAKFSGSVASNNIAIAYEATDLSGGVRHLSVKCNCDRTANPGDIVAGGEPTSSHYEMTLTSVHCCADSHSGGVVTVSVSLSAGTVITIVFFALLFLYVVVGLVVQKFGRKASGREVFPNVTFWMAAPGLVKDGVMFTFTCGRKGGYNKV